MIPYIQTKTGVLVYIKGAPFEVDQTQPHYQEVVDLLKQDSPDQADQIDAAINRALNAVKAAVIASPTSGVTLDNGVVSYNGEPLHNSLTDRIIRMVDEGFKVDSLVRFLEKLQQNPSFRVVNNLYDFLEYGKIPITEDGDFLAYKAIKSDWTDIHSGTLDNSIGRVVEVPRNKVDEDSSRTCSYGLHVCSFEYLQHFAQYDGRVVIVKVNPADVVAIPADYNNTKMRTARYEVLSEVSDYWQQRDNLLSSRSVFDTSQFGVDDDFDDGDEDEDDFENGTADEIVDPVQPRKGFFSWL